LTMGILASAGTAPLPGFLNSLAGPLDHWGYWAIALLLLLENIGVPVVPGELAMIGGAIFAGTGRAGLNVVVVAVVAFAASVAGAEIGYLIGRFAGRELILHFGKYVMIKPHHLDRAEAIVDRYGGFVVIIARFIVGLREANGIIAGITEMRWITFTIYNVIGAAAWVATWVTIGDLAGNHIDTVYRDVNRFALYVFIALVVLLAAYIARRVLRRRRSTGPDLGDAEDTGEAKSGRQQSGQPESGQPETGQPETGQPETGQPETGQPESDRPETVKPQGS
jgi:membrane protein DedA with SNARE-associated domain